MKEEKTEKSEFKGIVRIADKDIKGETILPKALARIRGIGVNLSENLAEVIAAELHIDRREKVGNLSDNQIKSITEILTNPMKFGIPSWMVNRKGEGETGQTHHIISSDLDFRQKQDIKAKIEMKSYQGIRHMYGLPVRGQRTKTMGRKGLTVGVVKTKMKPGEIAKIREEKGKKGKEKGKEKKE